MNKFKIVIITLSVWMIFFSQSLLALKCVDASNEAPGAFKAISVDEGSRTVDLTSYISDNNISDLKLIGGSGDESTYNFNEYLTQKNGIRFFKLFYIEVWDEWRMIDSIVLEQSGTQALLGVSTSITYTCTR